MLKEIQGILYSTEEGFEVPDAEEEQLGEEDFVLEEDGETHFIDDEEEAEAF